MKLSDIKHGMRLVAVGNYADCIVKGDEFTAYRRGGEAYVDCRGGTGTGKAAHGLTIMADDNGEIPEIEPLTPVDEIVAERRRQVGSEGWTPEHDDNHRRGQLARAASAYAYYGSLTPEERDTGGNYDSFIAFILRHLFPSWGTAYGGWDWGWWKPTNRRRDLIKAGALIVAEIERIDRVEAIASNLKERNSNSRPAA